jgi:ElaB/YqjD/DUF883 family membrane-anchored ribosome-binding protein
MAIPLLRIESNGEDTMNKNIEETRDSIDALVGKTADVAGGAADRAEKVVERAAEDVVGRAHEAGNYVRDKVESTARDVQQHVNDAAEAIDGRYTKARDQVSRVASAATTYTTSNPRTALLLALSVGFIIGFLTHRRQALA